MAGTLQDRAISVPSIVSHYTDEQLNSEYHNKADYQQAINKYGAIYKLIDFNDLKNKDEIKQAAIDWIKDHYFDGVIAFTVKAVDLHLLGFDKDKIRVGDRVTVEFIDIADTPITKTLTCLSEQIDILNPQNSTYKIGIPDTSLSLKRRWPGNGKGGSVSGKSSSGGGGGGGGNSVLYKYYTEQIKDSRETAQIHADDIYLISQQISSVVGTTKDLTWRVDTIDGSAVIQNSTEIVDVVGNFRIKSNYYGDWAPWNSTEPVAYKVGDKVTVEGRGFVCIKNCPADRFIPISNTEYWREDTGRKGVELIDGAAFELSDSDGGLLSVGQRINDLNAKTAEFEGSALWTQRDNITGVVGEYDIEVDQVTGRKTLIVKSGGGMKIRRDNVEYGLYDEGSLTGGLMVEKINTNGLSGWQQHTLYKVGDRVVVNGTGYVCITGHTSGDTFEQDSSKWLVMTGSKIIGERIELSTNDEFTTLVIDHNGLVNRVGTAETGISTLTNTAQGLTSRVTAAEGTIQAQSGQISTLSNTVDGFEAKLENVVDANGNVTAASIATAINSQGQAGVKLSGSWVDITAQQVRIGSTSNVDAWMTSTGTTLDTYYGLITDRATIGQLNTQKARIDTIEADYITANEIDSNFITSRISSSASIHCGNINSDIANSTYFTGTYLNGMPIIGMVRDVAVTDNGDGTYTLTKTFMNGNTRDYTFERGAGGEPEDYRLTYQSAPYTYHARVDVGGVWYESGDLYATNAYDNGWTGAYGTVEAYRVYTGSAGSTVELDYGESALIAARAKSTSGAQSKTAVDIIEVTAPAVVDVTHGSWTTAFYPTTGRASITFSPSEGTGAEQTLQIGLYKGSGVPTDGTQTLIVRGQITGESNTDIKSVPFAMTAGEWSSNKSLITAQISGSNICTLEVDASSVYTSGANSVTVTAAGWVGGSNVVSASNGRSVTVNLPPISLTGGTAFSSHKTTVYASGGGASGYVASMQVDATSEYEAGQTAAGLAIGTGNKVVRALSSSTKEYEIKAVASISYNSSTHKYTASAQSQAGSTNMGSDSKTGGTEAYDAGVADGYAPGWNAAYAKVSLPAASTSTATATVKYPASVVDTQTSQGFTVSADNTYAYIKMGSTTVARKSHSAYTNGVNSVTVASVDINGSPVVSATTLPVIATASNGATKTASLSISAQRTNAYNQGWNDCLDACGFGSYTKFYMGGSYARYAYSAPTSGAERYDYCRYGAEMATAYDVPARKT